MSDLSEHMTYNGLLELLEKAPVNGAWLSVHDTQALVVMILVRLDSLEAKLDALYGRAIPLEEDQ